VCKLTDWVDPDNLATLAAAYAEAGTYGEAVKWQQRAISLLATDDRRHDDFSARLQRYQAMLPLHEPIVN
jgi:hypothetical protein